MALKDVLVLLQCLSTGRVIAELLKGIIKFANILKDNIVVQHADILHTDGKRKLASESF